LKRIRKRDICLNAGIAFDHQKEAPFYEFPSQAHGLSTFSKKEADFWETTGNENIGKFKVAKVINMPLISINEVIRKYFKPFPNFISIDVEGLDLQILQTLDFTLYKPEVFCIECIRYSEGNKEQIDTKIIDFMMQNGYFIYADTHINSIFCRKDIYKPLQ
jgi:hypothetical protein